MKDIPGYEGLYAVTKDGKVWSYPKTKRGGHNGRWLAICVHTGGYAQVFLHKKNTKKKYFVHRLVATVYIPNPRQLLEINHKDADKFNNYHTNLEWATRQQNAAHAKRLKLYQHEPARGEKHPDAKLTNQDVVCIRKRYKKGEKQSVFCKEYQMSKSAISAVCNRKSWTHLPN